MVRWAAWLLALASATSAIAGQEPQDAPISSKPDDCAPCLAPFRDSNLDLTLSALESDDESSSHGLKLRLDVEYRGECPLFQTHLSGAPEFGMIVRPLDDASRETTVVPGVEERKRMEHERIINSGHFGNALLGVSLRPGRWYGTVHFSDAWATEDLKSFLIRRSREQWDDAKGTPWDGLEPAAWEDFLEGCQQSASLETNLRYVRFHGARRTLTLDVADYWKVPPKGRFEIAAFMIVHPETQHDTLLYDVHHVRHVFSNPVIVEDGKAIDDESTTVP